MAIPPGVSDEQAIMVSDIFPTAWFGARLAIPTALEAYEAFDCREPARG